MTLCAEERLGEHIHKVMSCPIPLARTGALASCNRADGHGYLCGGEPAFAGLPDDRPPYVTDVPAGMYLMICDNRDNSVDSRVWGFVAENLLVGKATRIWFNWDLQRSGGPSWSRIGGKIN